MTDALIQIVPFDPEERVYIRERLRQEQKQFWTVMKSLFALAILIGGTTVVAFEYMTHSADPAKQRLAEQNFPTSTYFWSLLLVVILIALCGFFSYRITLSKVVRDVKQGKKAIECTKISKKVFNPWNNSFYFYLESEAKLNIEVTANDFNFYREGDEINIKYGVWSKEYLGYY